MLYSLVEMNRVAMAPMRLAAKAGRAALLSPLNPLGKTEYGKSLAAFADAFLAGELSPHVKPDPRDE